MKTKEPKLQPYNAANLLVLPDSLFKKMYAEKDKTIRFFGDMEAVNERAVKLGLIKAKTI